MAVVRACGLAARLVAEGHVRLNARRIETPAKVVGPGDVLTIALERQVRVLKVVAPGARRGGFSEASLLFEDLSDPGICRPPGPHSGVAKVPRGRRRVSRILERL
jgi:ribosome-associated heat shock protein Hsp15